MALPSPTLSHSSVRLRATRTFSFCISTEVTNGCGSTAMEAASLSIAEATSVDSERNSTVTSLSGSMPLREST